MVTGSPARPTEGVNPVIVGAPAVEVTTNDELLVAEPPGAVTLIAPLVAPTGTFTTNWLAVADATVAAVPLNVTVFWLGVVLNPIPEMVTDAPTGPWPGVNEKIAIWVGL